MGFYIRLLLKFNYKLKLVTMKSRTLNNITSLMVAVLVILSTNALAQGGKVRNVSSFDELNLAISAKVYLKQGSTQKVEIEASDRLLEKIETEVKGDALNIKWNEKNVRHTEKIKVYITMKNVNALRIAGSGDIIADGKISTDNLELKISGSGNINLSDVNANKISSKISGSADISLKGNNIVNELSVAISGSGDVNTADLPANNVSVAISGSGDCKVHANETLKARVAGSGDVYYKGKATIDSKVAGSGSIKSL